MGSSVEKMSITRQESPGTGDLDLMVSIDTDFLPSG